MTAEEVIDNYLEKVKDIPVLGVTLFTATDCRIIAEEYAKQQSIQFGRTLLKHAESGIGFEKQYGWFRGGKMFNAEEIYEQFKNEKLF